MQVLAGDVRTEAITALQDYFGSERGETIGELAAGTFLDFIEKEFAWRYYNQGVTDAQTLVGRFAGSLDEELQVLERLPPR
jgi:uncharacterized protein (DUF2164 family)